MKVLVLTRYARQGASSRLRMFQYFPVLESSGFELSVNTLFGQWYLEYLKSPTRAGFRWYELLKSFFERFHAICFSRQFDLVWIQGEVFPWLPAFAERILNWRRIPYVVDYDDAVFHRYDRDPRLTVRKFLGHKIDIVMRRSALVVAGNDYLSKRAEQAGTNNVKIIPTVIDLNRYSTGDVANQCGFFTIGWIGSTTTTKYLNLVASALQSVNLKYPIRLLLIGAGPIDIPGIPIETYAWSEDSEIDLLKRCNVGIMPLHDSPWERGKCGYKLIQYMACGLPVVASPVGVNSRIVSHGESGFLASSSAEWEEYLKRLISKPDLRKSMGEIGRNRVETEFSLQVQAPRLVQYFRSLVS